MKLTFDTLANKHKNTSAIVVAHGPSLNQYIPKMEILKDKGHIIFDCNEWFTFHSAMPHYWVTANSEFTIKKHIDLYNSFDCTPLYASSVDKTPIEWAEENLNKDFFPYDQRNFGQENNLQYQLQKYTQYNDHYGAGDTVALHMLAFAIIMGCNPIYFIGIDLDESLGYAKNSANMAMPRNSISPYYDRNIQNLEIIKNSANQIGTDIFNLNLESKFHTFDMWTIS